MRKRIRQYIGILAAVVAGFQRELKFKTFGSRFFGNLPGHVSR